MADLKPRAPGKPYLALLPRKGLDCGAAAMEHGAIKYAPSNWRDCPPDELATYRHALLRHAVAYCIDNEVLDPESGVPHLGHIIAGASIMCEIAGLGYVEPRIAAEHPERRRRLISEAALFGPRPEHPADVKASPDAYHAAADTVPERREMTRRPRAQDSAAALVTSRPRPTRWQVLGAFFAGMAMASVLVSLGAVFGPMLAGP